MAAPKSPPIKGYQDNEQLLGHVDNEILHGWLDEALEPIPGQIDPVGGALGGVVGERVYTITATLFPDWENQSVATAVGDVPATAAYPTAGMTFSGGSFTNTPPLALRAATRNFVTLANDLTMPSVFWEDRLRDPGSVSLSLPLVPVGSAAVQTTIGTVVLDNTDGPFDIVLDENSAISQSIDIKVGRIGAWIEDFVTLVRARITGVGITETEATLELQDPVVYAQNLYPTTIYTGAGGIAGDAELEGVTRPVVIGRVWNMSPVLINAVSLIYQVHDGAIGAVTGVFDGGVALSFHANYASYAALAAATVPPGSYATSLAAGLVRVGGTPAFTLTAHVDGHSEAGTTVQSIATWLIEQLDAELGLEVDAESFDALPTWVAGWVWNDAFTFAEAISRFVGDGGFHWGADVTGIVRAVQLEPPDPDGEVAASYADYDIMSIQRASLPAGFEGMHHRRLVRYLKNWTVQSGSDLAATAVSRTYRQREWKTAVATVATLARNAIDPLVLDTSLSEVAGATELAESLLALHGTARRMIALDSKVFGESIPSLGSQVRVTYPRFGLSGGRLFRVVAVDLRLAESGLHLLLWG